MTPAKANKLEALRSRPRRRPDWTDMMKEVESGRKLRHVECNDRSAPIIPQEKTKGQVRNNSVLAFTSDDNRLTFMWFFIMFKVVQLNTAMLGPTSQEKKLVAPPW